MTIFLRGIAIGRTAIDALLTDALETSVHIDNANMRAVSIDVVIDESEFSLDGSGVENMRAERKLFVVHRMPSIVTKTSISV